MIKCHKILGLQEHFIIKGRIRSQAWQPIVICITCVQPTARCHPLSGKRRLALIASHRTNYETLYIIIQNCSKLFIHLTVRADSADERVGGDSDRQWWEKHQSVMDGRLPASFAYWRTRC